MPVPLILVPTTYLWGDLHMNTAQRISMIVILLFVATLTASDQTAKEVEKSFLSALKEGQSVSLKEVSGRYQISIFDGLPGAQSYKVIEIGGDHVVIQDISGVAETHIPVFSISSIVRMKLPRD